MTTNNPEQEKTPSLCEANRRIGEIEDRQLEQQWRFQECQKIEQEYERLMQLYETFPNAAADLNKSPKQDDEQRPYKTG